MDRAAVPRPASREVVPRSVMPNFRDDGRRTVDRALLKVLGNLQKGYGHAFASEGGLRHMIAQDTGLMPGKDTIRAALKRLELQGLLEQRWLRAGGIKPDGSECSYGTRLIHLPQDRRSRRTLATLAAQRDRREGTQERIQRRNVLEIQDAVKSLAKPLALRDTRDTRARADEELRKHEAELRALYEEELRKVEDAAKVRPPD